MSKKLELKPSKTNILFTSICAENLLKDLDNIYNRIVSLEELLDNYLDDNNIDISNHSDFYSNLNLNTIATTLKLSCNVKNSYSDQNLVSLLARNYVDHTDFIATYNDNLDDVNYDYDCQFKVYWLSNENIGVESMSPSLLYFLKKTQIRTQKRYRRRRYRRFYKKHGLVVIRKWRTIHINKLLCLFLLKEFNLVKWSDNVDYCFDDLHNRIKTFFGSLKMYRVLVYL
jgi:hypothetical protein